jgi:serine phosphatase RsbU (regulator of sigma subunit)
MGYPAVLLCLAESNVGQLAIRAASGQLDKFLWRRGDTPTRRIAFPLKNAGNPFSLTYETHQIQDAPLEAWAAALRQVGASDVAQALTKQNISHCQAFPIWRGDEVIGILVVGHIRSVTLPDEEHILLTSLTNQIAMVVTNASLYQAEQQGRREMEALYRAGLVITSTLSHAEVLKAIIQQIVDLTYVEGCIIGKWDQTKDAEVIEAYLHKTSTGWIEKEPSGTAYPLSERLTVKEALQSQRIKVVHRVTPGLGRREREWMVQAEARVRLIVPLIIRDQSIGVLELITTQEDWVFTDHVIRLAQSFAAQASIALENARLHEAEVKRIEQEMDLAQRIQISLLPEETPNIPDLSIAARSVSARLVGGDFYRYLSLPDNKFGVVVGDVSGKGVPSAIFMAITITTMDTQIRKQTSPGNMLRRLNSVLYPRMQPSGMNTGLLVAIFDLEKHCLNIANAGMIAPLLKQQQGFDWIDVSGFPVGAVPQSSYEDKTLSLTADMAIILTSDGIIEAKNQDGEIFGFERFLQATQQLPPLASSEEILEQIWQNVTEHTQGAEPHDDMTLVIIKTSG